MMDISHLEVRSLRARAGLFAEVRWYAEAPRSRIVLCGYLGLAADGFTQSARYPERWRVFAVVREFGRFKYLLAFSAHEYPSKTTIILPSDLGNRSIRGRVCLGTASRSVVRGRLDPISAYWNSAFTPSSGDWSSYGYAQSQPEVMMDIHHLLRTEAQAFAAVAITGGLLIFIMIVSIVIGK